MKSLPSSFGAEPEAARRHDPAYRNGQSKDHRWSFWPWGRKKEKAGKAAGPGPSVSSGEYDVIHVDVRSLSIETPQTRWIRRILVLLVLLCATLAVFVWLELLLGGPP